MFLKNSRRYLLGSLLLAGTLAGASNRVLAQNPLIQNQFTADPSARVFGDRVYVYPSHDILCEEGKGRPGWFCMEDYHVFSSANLADWTDHGVIVRQDKVPWVNDTTYSMWAPDCIYRNGKYYFYFPSRVKDTTLAKGFSIGVAVADQPTGPFTVQPKPIRGVRGIDPAVFLDKDGQAYLYWAEGHLYMARLKENMQELASEPQVIANLPDKGLKEGPYLFERNGLYYLTYPHVANKTERLEYAIGKSPMGPFTPAGVIMDESASGCWTNHQSILQYKGQWYLFYHHNDLSPQFDKNRSIRADSLFFLPDGTIQKVVPTLRGVGLTGAQAEIQLDRYSRLSDRGASIAFLDPQNTFRGWKTVLEGPGAWVQYNSVDFGKKTFRSVGLRGQSSTGGTIQVRAGGAEGPLLAEVNIPKGKDWGLVKASLRLQPSGTKNLFVSTKGAGRVELDWIRFE
ncbi:family 43 glycosylhydrolase [Paraflavisolibacter sp. H34]|uniref:family 43 glycosylhydrolase n=1 Tax=Huijunlia imazamoxiresistens TaxID=3127457 RepID=UPI003015C41C